MDADDLATFERFLQQLRGMRLHPSHEHGMALKKPLLMLLIISRIGQGRFNANRIHFADIRRDLDELIREFGGRPTPRGTRPEQPFSHLRTSPFWHLTTQQSYPNRRTVPVSDLMNPESFAAIDDGVFRLLVQSSYLRARAADLILDLWWSETLHSNLRESVGLNATRLTEMPERDSTFAESVLLNYRHSCAFCGFNALVGGRATGVDAAHIRWPAQDGPDVPENGIALCKIHHWALDRGVLGLDDDLRIRLSSEFRCRHDGGIPLESLLGKPLTVMPVDCPPAVKFLEWHRLHVFLG